VREGALGGQGLARSAGSPLLCCRSSRVRRLAGGRAEEGGRAPARQGRGGARLPTRPADFTRGREDGGPPDLGDGTGVA
jgi:hypothetical protein